MRVAYNNLRFVKRPDVACADPPLVGTGLRGAKYGGRVHACCYPGRVDRTRLLIACRIRPVLVILAPFHTLTGLYRAMRDTLLNHFRDEF